MGKLIDSDDKTVEKLIQRLRSNINIDQSDFDVVLSKVRAKESNWGQMMRIVSNSNFQYYCEKIQPLTSMSKVKK